ncbi:DUF4031 domain-containing protein [Paraburkholderia sp. SIMBA_054]|uniref:DUF4031 domain-containing protein n=1 Tax=Paraburkholderia sp. SIMBA_054 TaxID=3085795 RepID=UPI00397AA90F
MMPVYVDDMRIPYRRMLMCHMIASDDALLHDMAARLGLDRGWHEGPPLHESHYNLAQSTRDRAISFGAIAITRRQAAAMVARRRETGALGEPEDAIGWLRQRNAQRRQVSESATGNNPRPEKNFAPDLNISDPDPIKAEGIQHDA